MRSIKLATARDELDRVHAHCEIATKKHSDLVDEMNTAERLGVIAKAVRETEEEWREWKGKKARGEATGSDWVEVALPTISEVGKRNQTSILRGSLNPSKCTVDEMDRGSATTTSTAAAPAAVKAALAITDPILNFSSGTAPLLAFIAGLIGELRVVRERRDNLQAELSRMRVAADIETTRAVEALERSEVAQASQRTEATPAAKPATDTFEADIIDAADIEAPEANVLRKVNSLLNDLTFDNIELISDQIVHVRIETLPILVAVVTLLFEKAIDAQYLVSVHAALAFKLWAELPKVQPWISSDAKNNSFCRAMLNKCQQEFNDDDRKAFARLKAIDDPEEEIEAFCLLLVVVGRQLDYPAAAGHMKSYLIHIERLRNNTKPPSRIHYTLQDLLNLRASKWVQTQYHLV
ncbi:armadillo-type protein [Blyttiomyces helicus]|uniref:Armadillo-type protein n=1 Tax=Blyttiomyces helicus TaxID=388810 RepID=A0A4P9W8M2_9FUNG|nr:armadillo-type protein [Blyttiomyces helicus]|eukprot:RKO88879.1 armadillo-type protein [Blyttiomyces helicus]